MLVHVPRGPVFSRLTFSYRYFAHVQGYYLDLIFFFSGNTVWNVSQLSSHDLDCKRSSVRHHQRRIEIFRKKRFDGRMSSQHNS